MTASTARPSSNGSASHRPWLHVHERHLRPGQTLGQHEVARMLGISEATVSRWGSPDAKTSPTFDHLCKLLASAPESLLLDVLRTLADGRAYVYASDEHTQPNPDINGDGELNLDDCFVGLSRISTRMAEAVAHYTQAAADHVITEEEALDLHARLDQLIASVRHFDAALTANVCRRRRRARPLA